MNYSRTQFDLQNYNPLLKDVFYELEEPSVMTNMHYNHEG